MKRLIIIFVVIIAFNSSQAQDIGVEVALLKQFAIPKDAPVNEGVQSTKIAFSYLFYTNALMLGPGVGIDFANWKDLALPNSNKITSTSLDPFVRIKYDFLRGRLTPYISADGGYSFMIGSNVNSANQNSSYKRDGFFFTPAIGIDFWIPRFCVIDLSVGYNFLNQGTNDHFKSGYSIQSGTIRLALKF